VERDRLLEEVLLGSTYFSRCAKHAGPAGPRAGRGGSFAREPVSENIPFRH